MQGKLSRIAILVFAAVLLGLGTSPVPVQAATPVISVSMTSGTPGTSVVIIGSGFSANETAITVTYDGAVVAFGIQASPLGDWSASFVVPPSFSGYHLIDAYGSSTLTANVTDINFLIFPGISVSTANAAAGSSVNVTGFGFGASETGITVTYDGKVVASGISANSKGSWSSSFVVPASPSGSHAIDAYGSSSLAASVADFTFTVAPSIALNQTNTTPGNSVTVTGSGFSAKETGITVTYDGVTVASNLLANSQGGWTATFLVPPSPPGSHAIGAYGTSTLATAVSARTLVTSPGLFLTVTKATPGATVTITGSGFGVNETGIAVTYGGNAVASGITADAQGGWSTAFVVPDSPSGSYIVDASGSSTLATTVKDITLIVIPGISLGRTSAVPGVSITVAGSAFGANETGIEVVYDGKVVASGISVGPTGKWSANFVIPPSPSGSRTVDAYGSSTLATAVADATIAIVPAISTSRTAGAAESSITVSGVGFAAGETGITVTYDGKAMASGITADSLGRWSVTLTVPASPSGTHSIGASGSITQTAVMNEAGFDIAPRISVDPASGNAGDTIQIRGSGFAMGSPLRLGYDDRELPGDGMTTDDSGSFTKSITVPESQGGSHTIIATDGQGNESRATFTMESNPPPAPVLLSPHDGARLAFTGDATPTLRWSGVTDPSGVRFVLQMDTSPDFSYPVLEKTDITGSRYSLTRAEALPRGKYYWRVRAIDGASNQSPWSPTWLLSSGIMPLWALIAIIVASLAMAGTVAYIFLVRLKRGERELVTAIRPQSPQAVYGQWRLLEPGESTGHRFSRVLALPQTARKSKTFTPEKQAQLKVIMDFAQSLPLVQPGYSANWVLDLLRTGTDIEESAGAYERLLKGELQVRYEAAWMRHPTYHDLAALLAGQPILQELDAFVDRVNRAATEASLLLQDIYRDALAEMPQDFLARGGWSFVAAVYSDALNWFVGKSLNEPSERDYSVRPCESDGERTASLCLWGEETTSFAGTIVHLRDEKEALPFRSLHLRLRRAYRNSDRARQLVAIMTQLEVQR
ncbi:MAG: hypothetical protein HYX83_04755, partial [Chloroflexi bacterium]|nr:hypothetical protein [Chloroflexota bacterium]